MKQLLKKLLNSIKLFFDTFVSIIDVLCFGHPFAKKPKINRTSESAAVLANGPSAKDIIKNQPELLTSCDLIAMNDAAVSEDFDWLKPRYYILLDPAYFGGAWLCDNELTENHYDEVLDKLFAKLYGVKWEMTLFLPFNKKADVLIKKFQNHDFVKIERYNVGRVQGFTNYCMWALKHGLGLPSSRNIVIPTILQMINAEYKNIYLYGAELSGLKYMDVDIKTGLLFKKDRHFYCEDSMRYYGKGTYLVHLESLAEMLRGINLLSVYAKKRGVNVVNRTKGSFIDAFEYENPDTLLKV